MAQQRKTIPLENTPCILCQSSEAQLLASGFDYEYWVSEQEFHFASCARCGHIFQNPRPKLSSASRLYPSNYYTLAGRHTKASSRLIALAKKMVIGRRLAFFGRMLKKGCHVLEVGSGDCNLLLNLKQKYPNSEFTGIDLVFSKSAINACKLDNISLLKGSIEEIALPQNTYDIVIMNQLIEHLWKPVQVLQKLHGALRRNGFLNIETPNISGYDRKFFVNSKWGGYYYPRHLNLFSFESLAKLLKKTGYNLVRQKNLVAPIIWTFSLHGSLGPTKNRQQSLWAKFFTDRNPLCLAFFSFLDFIAIKSGLTSSNQKTIAKKIKK